MSRSRISHYMRMIGFVCFWGITYIFLLDKAWFNFSFLLNEGYSSIYTRSLSIYGVITSLTLVAAFFISVCLGYQTWVYKINQGVHNITNRRFYGTLIYMLVGIIVFYSFISGASYFWKIFPPIRLFGSIPNLEISALVILFEVFCVVKVKRHFLEA
jgi:hypothetical protein